MAGDGRRYVTRERLEAMLDFEYLQCDLTLRSARGDSTAFFAFADTVTAKVPYSDMLHGEMQQILSRPVT